MARLISVLMLALAVLIGQADMTAQTKTTSTKQKTT